MNNSEEILTDYVIGSSEVARALRERIAQVSDSDVPVLISGPTGAGKEYAARGIHALSGREGQVISINCGAIPENLVEAELFGYERGAFSGADKRHIGHIERAHDGTLFLDEIGDLPLELQVKLLRVIETHRFYRVGGKSEVNVNFRLVAASHKDLEDAVQQGNFREDLLYRINTIMLDVPPLRQRGEDITDYFRLFLKNYELRNSKNLDIAFADDFWQGLVDYDWPGNIRELRNVVERAGIYFAGKLVSGEDLQTSLLSKKKIKTRGEEGVFQKVEPDASFEDALSEIGFGLQVSEIGPNEDALGRFFDDMFDGNGSEARLDFQELIKKIEATLIKLALERAGGNISKAANILQLSRSTLSSKILKKKS